ncbi:hypothetical protein ACEQ8H_002033 [Pleosporales sp. CAS-2024a]
MPSPAIAIPPITSLCSAPDHTLTATLDALFEPSPALHTLSLPLLRSITFPAYTALIAAIQAQLLALVRDSHLVATLDDILRAHPRLGARNVHSAQSRAEQAQLQAQGQGGDDDDEARLLGELNAEYEGRFEGVFVNEMIFMLRESKLFK